MSVPKVAVVAMGMSRFGIRPATYRDLISEAGRDLYRSNPRLRAGDIEGLLVSSVMPERFVFQTHVAPLAAECLGINPRRIVGRVELLCGSGSTAVHLALAYIKAGLADVMAVAGVEKMNGPNPAETAFHTLAASDREWEGIHGLAAPVGFSFVAQRHRLKYGTTEEQMAAVSVKNRANAALNPRAHFQKPITLEQALSARPIARPLKLCDCCPVTDGAAVIVLAREEKAYELTDRPIWILGAAQTAGGNNLANVPGWEEWPALRDAAKRAFAQAGVGPKEVQAAEIHDCFSISEIIETEELGFAPKGEGGAWAAEGRSAIGGEVAINPGGGLIGRGHPFGATGVAQIIEIATQLRGEAGERQVPNARIGLTHNLSGFTTEHTVTILGSELP